MSDRYWANDAAWNPGQLEAIATPGHVVLSVTQDCAVDSYNEEFTCSVNLARAQLEDFIEWLRSALAAMPS